VALKIEKSLASKTGAEHSIKENMWWKSLIVFSCASAGV
jgi:hypothetical protein